MATMALNDPYTIYVSMVKLYVPYVFSNYNVFTIIYHRLHNGLQIVRFSRMWHFILLCGKQFAAHYCYGNIGMLLILVSTINIQG